jgi:hypothetical protein
MGPIRGPDDSFFIVIGILAVCGLVGLGYACFSLIVWLFNHMRFI